MSLISCSTIIGSGEAARSLAKETGVFRYTAQQAWTAFGLRSHRREQFLFLKDPLLMKTMWRWILGWALWPLSWLDSLCADKVISLRATGGFWMLAEKE